MPVAAVAQALLDAGLPSEAIATTLLVPDPRERAAMARAVMADGYARELLDALVPGSAAATAAAGQVSGGVVMRGSGAKRSSVPRSALVEAVFDWVDSGMSRGETWALLPSLLFFAVSEQPFLCWRMVPFTPLFFP